MMILLNKNYILTCYKARRPDTHKGDYGHALLIAGSADKMGAAVIASKACLRSGAGLLTVLTSKSQAWPLQTCIPEAMLLFELPQTFKYSAIGIGPGIGTGTDSKDVCSKIINAAHCPLVIDADALNILANNQHMLGTLPANTILTPHAKEFDRLFGIHSNEQERVLTAKQQSKEYPIIIVLKGHETKIIHQDQVYQNTTGNAGLAKGGAGDALTGMVTAFLAQGYTPLKSAILGVYLHGLAADITLQSQSVESMLITDVIEHIGDAFKTLL
ncbi:MAG: NAD(P)H-hydrate dehydratase [Bacteroidetes bacterium]|nr:NAD(P)H-hydrate dehydratase [Bacteroidota bacterium]MBK7039905.1 NAD(P)H-hydrate dehydratase [Bacteroidota bacterium]MBK9301428.1 NAD(P)H-hydrate dehydratase [Bacteroidota bacterium]